MGIAAGMGASELQWPSAGWLPILGHFCFRGAGAVEKSRLTKDT